jgi:SAM-dependent methyltransferase
LCGSTDWADTGQGYSSSRDRWYPLSRCGGCGLQGCLEWVRRPPAYEPTYYSQTGAPRTSARLWTKLALETAPGRIGERLSSALLTVRVPPPPHFGARLLDVGCGNGELLARAVVLGWTAEGCEVDDEACTAARARGFPCYAGEWWDKLPQERFDLIIMSHVLEHLPDPRRALTGVVRALETKGALVIGMPNFASAHVQEYEGLSWVIMPPEHVWHLRPDDVRRLAEEAGLEIVETHTQPAMFDALAPRRLKTQYDVCRRAGRAEGFAGRYFKATLAGLRDRGDPPRAHATIYSFTCRRR